MIETNAWYQKVPHHYSRQHLIDLYHLIEQDLLDVYSKRQNVGRGMMTQYADDERILGGLPGHLWDLCSLSHVAIVPLSLPLQCRVRDIG